MGLLALFEKLLSGKLDMKVFDNFGGIGIEIKVKILEKNKIPGDMAWSKN